MSSTTVRDDSSIQEQFKLGHPIPRSKSWPILTDKQRAFCRSYVANGGNASQAAKTAGYLDHGPEGTKLLKKQHWKRSIREEIERLQVAIAKAGNQIMVDALVGTDQPEPVDTGLAASLVAPRGATHDRRSTTLVKQDTARMLIKPDMPCSPENLVKVKQIRHWLLRVGATSPDELVSAAASTSFLLLDQHRRRRMAPVDRGQ